MPKAHSIPHVKIQELVQAIEGLDVDMLQQIFGRAVIKHGMELVNKVDNDHREPIHDISHLNYEGMLQASQIMVQQLVEKGMLKGTIPKLDNFNGDPQTTKISFHVWEKQVIALLEQPLEIVSRVEHCRKCPYFPLMLVGRFCLTF